jgi:histidine triad (HIT) family protein
MPTIFEKIIAREIPANIVHEDTRTIAFLDISPLSEGHTLLVPKTPAKTLAELPYEDAAAIGRVLPALCAAIVETTGCDQYNILQNNGTRAHQAVEHVHFHIIPKPSDTEGLGIGWNTRQVDDDDAKALADRIKSAFDSGH